MMSLRAIYTYMCIFKYIYIHARYYDVVVRNLYAYMYSKRNAIIIE